MHYNAFISDIWPPQNVLQLSPPLTHSYTDGSANRARQQPARRERSGLGVLHLNTKQGGAVDRSRNPPVTTGQTHEPLLQFPEAVRKASITVPLTYNPTCQIDSGY